MTEPSDSGTPGRVSDEFLAEYAQWTTGDYDWHADVGKMARELLALRKASGEPVAWMYRSGWGDGPWNFAYERPESRFEARPLYLHPPATGAASDGWIAVSERLPERGVHVLIWTSAKVVCVAKWGGRRWLDPFDDSHHEFSPPPTHWQPLPDAPKAGA